MSNLSTDLYMWYWYSHLMNQLKPEPSANVLKNHCHDYLSSYITFRKIDTRLVSVVGNSLKSMLTLLRDY